MDAVANAKDDEEVRVANSLIYICYTNNKITY